MDFSALKNRSGKGALEQLTQELSKLTATESKGDDRFWRPEVDKAGNGYAVIRFLPAPGNEEVPFVRLFKHSFKGPDGQWYIENSLTTIGKPDPVGQLNSTLWNSTTDDKSPAREQARLQKRKLTYITNIYIVQDSANPENNGKIKLFSFGKKIFDKLNDAMNPQYADETPMNPFDLWEGANFKLKIRTVEGYLNYDKSEFDKPSALFDDDKKLEAIWKSEHLLQPFLAPENFKSYEELEARMRRVLCMDKPSPQASRQAATTRKPSIDEGADELLNRLEPKQERTAEPRSQIADDGDDSDLEFFRKLAS